MRRKYQRRPWTKAEDRTMRRLYATTAIQALMQQFNRKPGSIHNQAAKLGLKKSAEFLADTARIRSKARTGAARGQQFKPGQHPWNYGMKGLQLSPDTQFAKGNRPHTWVPVGTKRVTSEGYQQRKVSDTGHNLTDWRNLHHMLWERYRGPIPKGHTVIFKDKDRANIKIANLECISRGDLARRNSPWNLPPELARLIQLRGALNRQINKRERDAQQN